MRIRPNKYTPHQGKREIARRLRQMKAFWKWLPGCKLGPDSMGQKTEDFNPNCFNEDDRW